MKFLLSARPPLSLLSLLSLLSFVLLHPSTTNLSLCSMDPGSVTVRGGARGGRGGSARAGRGGRGGGRGGRGRGRGAADISASTAEPVIETGAVDVPVRGRGGARGRGCERGGKGKGTATSTGTIQEG